MIWDFNSSNMEELNTNEIKQTMNFHIYTIAMLGFYEGTHRLILGQVMDLNYFTWFFNLVLAKQACLAHSFTPTHPTYTFVASPIGIPMLMPKGSVVVTTRVVYP
jgi:hypothetical protein